MVRAGLREPAFQLTVDRSCNADSQLAGWDQEIVTVVELELRPIVPSREVNIDVIHRSSLDILVAS